MSIVTSPKGWKRTRSVSVFLSSTFISLLIYTWTTPARADDSCWNRRSMDDSCADDANGWRAFASNLENKPALWQGLYIGADLGGSVGGVTIGGITNDDFTISGFTGGLHAGYSALWDNVLFGVEFDIQRSNTNGELSFANANSITSDLDWLSSSRIRLGYISGDYLFYATGGLAYASQDIQFSSGGISYSNDESLYGYALGGGIEMKITESMSARIEAIHYDFSEKTYDLPNARIEADADVTTIRAGLSMHFN